MHPVQDLAPLRVALLLLLLFVDSLARPCLDVVGKLIKVIEVLLNGWVFCLKKTEGLNSSKTSRNRDEKFKSCALYSPQHVVRLPSLYSLGSEMHNRLVSIGRPKKEHYTFLHNTGQVYILRKNLTFDTQVGVGLILMTVWQHSNVNVWKQDFSMVAFVASKKPFLICTGLSCLLLLLMLIKLKLQCIYISMVSPNMRGRGVILQDFQQRISSPRTD